MDAAYGENMEDKDISNIIQPAGISQTPQSPPSRAILAVADDDDSNFDPDNIRLDQDFASDHGIKLVLTVRVHAPEKQVFFRVHSSPEYRVTTSLIELKDSKETYLVDRSLLPYLQIEITNRTIFTCIDRLNNVFLWP